MKVSSLRSGSAVFLLASLLQVTAAEPPPDKILLKDYKPHSIFKIPETRVEQARYPVIDVHTTTDRLPPTLIAG